MTALGFQQGCPQCGANTSLLHAIDQGMKLRLEKEGSPTSFDAVCTSCFKGLSKNLSNASFLHAEKQIQKNFKLNLWKNRLNLIRHARNLLALKDYAQAAVCYEKYLKVIEYIYETKRRDLKAVQFKESPREVTLMCGALWALVEIYDLHPNYWPKQEECATKLGELLSYTNLFTTIVKKASVKRKHARNPKAYKILLKATHVSHGFCFIATAAYPDRNDPTVKTLRQFRDQILVRHASGRAFIRVYYAYSPGLANRLQHNDFARKILRKALPQAAASVKLLFKLQD